MEISKYLSKPDLLTQNPNLNYLVEPSFQGVNRLFLLGFENDAQRKSNTRYCLPNVQIKDYNAMIDGKNDGFDQPVKNNKITYENIKKLLLIKEMIAQLVICYNILISKKIIN